MWPPSMLADRYVLGRSLGQGGMGSVWQGEDQVLGRTVAVKLIQLASQSDETAQVRFTREARAAAGLVHPNIVTVHDFGVDDEIAFMVMECLPGPDLATLVRRKGPLPVDQALGYLEQAAAGLAAAHSRGILHRDMKPANLVLTSLGTVKVLDFGIAALADHSEQLTAASQLIGTFSYLAPERSMGVPASVQSDLYALGCVAVTLLTGKPQFEGTTGQIVLKHLNEPPPRLTLRRADLPAGLEELIGSLLAKDPSMRPLSAEDVVNQLRATRLGQGVGDHAARTAAAVVPSVQDPPTFSEALSATIRRPGREQEVPGTRASASASYSDGDTRLRLPDPKPTTEPTAPLRATGPNRWLLAAGLTAVALAVTTAFLLGERILRPTAAVPAPIMSSSAATIEATAPATSEPATPARQYSEPAEEHTNTAVAYTCWDGVPVNNVASCSRPADEDGLKYIFPSLSKNLDGNTYDCTYTDYSNRRVATFSYDCPLAGQTNEATDQLVRYRYWSDSTVSRAHYRKVFDQGTQEDFILDGQKVGTIYSNREPDEFFYGRYVMAFLMLDGHMCLSIEGSSPSLLSEMVTEARFRAAKELYGHSGDSPTEGRWDR